MPVVTPGVHLCLKLSDLHFGAERTRGVKPLLRRQGWKFAALAQNLETKMFDNLRLFPALAAESPTNGEEL